MVNWLSQRQRGRPSVALDVIPILATTRTGLSRVTYPLLMNSQTPWTLSRDEFNLAELLASKNGSVAVIIPAKNEAATVGAVLEAVKGVSGLIDELVVVDDDSTDDTAIVAERHGATVVSTNISSGKGNALAVGVGKTSAEYLVFLDADVTNTDETFVPRLLQPLFARPEISLVKGYYERPLLHMPTGGGRVNELAARPILSLLYPGLGEVRQPLAGETALRRRVLDDIALEPTYAVEIGLLIDVATKIGVNSIAQVDLGVRVHRNRPLEELRPMAMQILRCALERKNG